MKQKSVVLREATPKDIPLLQYWDTMPHFIACDPDSDWQWETELIKNCDWKQEFIAEVENKPIGFIQIMDPFKEPDQYWGKVSPNLMAIDIWIGEPSYLNQGFGTQMMSQAINHCFQDPNKMAIVIDPLTSNVDAIRFYQRLGFVFTEERNFDGDDCSVHQLERSKWATIKNSLVKS